MNETRWKHRKDPEDEFSPLSAEVTCGRTMLKSDFTPKQKKKSENTSTGSLMHIVKMWDESVEAYLQL